MDRVLQCAFVNLRGEVNARYSLKDKEKSCELNMITFQGYIGKDDSERKKKLNLKGFHKRRKVNKI